MAGFLEEVAMDVGIVEHKERYYPDPRGVAGGQPQWSPDAYDQGLLIEMGMPSPTPTVVNHRRVFSDTAK